MKKIFILACLFILIGTTAFSNYSKIDNDLNEQTVVQTGNEVVLESITIYSTIGDGGTCEMTAEVSLGYNNTYVRITFTVTADTCIEALEVVMDTVEQIKEWIR